MKICDRCYNRGNGSVPAQQALGFVINATTHETYDLCLSCAAEIKDALMRMEPDPVPEEGKDRGRGRPRKNA
jgi:hypothetical protein